MLSGCLLFSDGYVLVVGGFNPGHGQTCICSAANDAVLYSATNIQCYSGVYTLIDGLPSWSATKFLQRHALQHWGSSRFPYQPPREGSLESDSLLSPLPRKQAACQCHHNTWLHTAVMNKAATPTPGWVVALLLITNRWVWEHQAVVEPSAAALPPSLPRGGGETGNPPAPQVTLHILLVAVQYTELQRSSCSIQEHFYSTFTIFVAPQAGGTSVHPVHMEYI